MLYIAELCEDCAVANEIDYEIDDAWTNIHGIHDNGPRDHGLWRLTLKVPWNANACWFVLIYNTLTITNVAKRLFKYVPYILL